MVNHIKNEIDKVKRAGYEPDRTYYSWYNYAREPMVGRIIFNPHKMEKIDGGYKITTHVGPSYKYNFMTGHANYYNLPEVVKALEQECINEALPKACPGGWRYRFGQRETVECMGYVHGRGIPGIGVGSRSSGSSSGHSVEQYVDKVIKNGKNANVAGGCYKDQNGVWQCP